MRSYKEIVSFLLIRKQLALGWKIGFFIVCGALLYVSLTLSHIRIRSVEIQGTVVNRSSQSDYLLVRIDNGDTVQARALSKQDYLPGRRVVVKATTTNFFGMRKYEIKSNVPEINRQCSANDGDSSAATLISFERPGIGGEEIMPRVAIEDFEEQEVSRVYVATRLSEAKLVEEVLTQNDIDYAVEVEPYLTTVMFWITEYKGATFLVFSEQVEICQRVLGAAGLTAGLVNIEPN